MAWGLGRGRMRVLITSDSSQLLKGPWLGSKVIPLHSGDEVPGAPLHICWQLIFREHS